MYSFPIILTKAAFLSSRKKPSSKLWNADSKANPKLGSRHLFPLPGVLILPVPSDHIVFVEICLDVSTAAHDIGNGQRYMLLVLPHVEQYN